jgi:APA family basic amino acid/polyamine antiporter
MTPRASVGLGSAIAIVIGNMIGVSIYSSLGYQVAAPAAHSVGMILLLWAVGAGIAALGALSYAELAGAFPQSGGEYHFLRQAYPPSIGFLSGWISLVVGFPGPVAIGALALGQYLLGFVTGYSWSAEAWEVRGVAVGAIVLTCGMHCFPLRRASQLHDWFTAAKVLFLVAFMVAGFMAPATSQPVEWWPAEPNWSWAQATACFTSLYFVLYAYAGWNSACYIAGEVSSPQRNVPRALLIGLAITFVLYVGLMAAFLHATPRDALAGSGLGAAQAAALVIFGDGGARVVNGLISLALISFLSGTVWAGSRVAQRMGQDYRFIGILGKASPRGVPRTAVLVQGGIALLMVLLFDAPYKLMLYVEFLLQISIFLTVLGVIILRVRQPELARPVRVWGYPYTPILFLCWIALCMGFFLHGQHEQAMQGLATLAAGAAVYWLCKAEQ